MPWLRCPTAIALGLLFVGSGAAKPKPVEVELKLPPIPVVQLHAIAYEPSAPPAFEFRARPSEPPLQICNLGVLDVRRATPLNPPVVLSMALRGARHVEIWRLNRLETPSALASTPWTCFQYRNSVITGFTRSRDIALLCSVEAKLLDALIDGEENWLMDEVAVRAENLPEMVASTRFEPDFVATFDGPNPVRVEVSFRTDEAVIRTKGQFTWLSIPSHALLELRALAASLELPSNPRMVPVTEFRAR